MGKTSLSSTAKGNIFLLDQGHPGHLKALSAAPCAIINSVILSYGGLMHIKD